MKKILKYVGIGLVAIFILIQFVPYGHQHTNPAVVSEPNWDSPQTRELAKRACFDCHSNETTWPWYSNIAPISWQIQIDVDYGRRALNFSNWARAREVNEIPFAVQRGFMPPSNYLLTHPQAKLTQAEKDALVAGLQATIKNP